MNGPVISFVVAARDEAASVVALHGEIEAAMREVGGAWELIFVDDGSTDATFERVRELHARHPQVRAIRFTQNFGKSAALTAGFEAARGDIVITLDGDLQDDPREIPRFLAALDEGFDLVSGWKRTRRDPLGKRVASRIFNRGVARLTGLRLHDINCGFKAYRAEVTRGLRLRHGLHRFIPFLAKARGFRIGEIVVAHRARVHGRSKYGWERIPQALVDVHLAWLAARGIERPLAVFGPVGAALAASSAAWAGASIAASHAAWWPWAAIWVLAGLVGIYILVMAFLTARAIAREPEGASYSVAERLPQGLSPNGDCPWGHRSLWDGVASPTGWQSHRRGKACLAPTRPERDSPPGDSPCADEPRAGRPQAAHRLRQIAAVVQTVILAAAVAYIAWGLAGQWAELRRHAWTLRPLPALLSLTLAAGWFVLRVRLWQRILACFGYPLAYRRAYRTWLLSELSRYLPGTVWHVLSRSHLSGRQGVPAPVALTGIMLELALVALVAVALFPLRAIGYGHPLEGVGIWALAAALALLVFAHPQVVVPLVNAGLRRLSRPAIQARLRYRDLFGMLALCAAMWLCLCLGFAAFAYAIAPAAGGAPPAGRSAIAIAASFPVAWVVGLVAVAAPGGLGVREGVLAALLSGVLPGGVAVVVALASRVWLTGVELLCAAVAWRLRE